MKMSEWVTYQKEDYSNACICDNTGPYSRELVGKWMVCKTCHKPLYKDLNDCDTCDVKFQGIRPGIKFAYTCPECE